MLNLRKKLIPLLALIIIGDLILSNFAFAQSTTKLTKADWEKAQPPQGNLASCKEFSDKVKDYTFGEYQAAWVYEVLSDPGAPGASPISYHCQVVPSFYPNTIDGQFQPINLQDKPLPPGGDDIEQRIINSQGIDKKIVADAIAKDVKAQNEAGLLSRLVGGVIEDFLKAISGFLGVLTMLAGSIFTIAANDVLKISSMPPIVEVGWGIVRDFSNMFFILILIVISIASILRIEKYNYKKLLAQVVIAALLVNFSKVIATTLIYFVNSIALIFVPSQEGFGFQEIGRFFANVVFSSQMLGQSHLPLGGWQEGVVVGLSSVFFAIVSAVTFAALAVLFIIRLIGLYVLVILSPFAYVLYILPDTQNLAKKWWQYFVKYLIWAPVALFFVKLAILTVDNGGMSNVIGTNSNFRVLIISALLFFSVIVAKQAGMIGASGVISMAEKGAALPGKIYLGLGKAGVGLVARTYSGWMGRKVGEESMKAQRAAGRIRKAEIAMQALQKEGKLTPEEKTKFEKQIEQAQIEKTQASRKSFGFRAASMLDPHVLKEAWKKRTEEKTLRAYAPAIGHMQDTFNRIVPTEFLKPSRLKQYKFGKKTYHGLVGERSVVAKETKDMLEGVRSAEDAVRIMQGALESGDKDEIMAGWKILQHGNWQDDFSNAEGMTYSIPRFGDFMTQKMKEKGFSKEEIITILDDLKETAEANKRIRGYGLTTSDPDGVTRAFNDLEYYQKLGQEDLVKEFTRLGERFKLAFEETKSPEFAAVAFHFDNAAKRAAKGEEFKSIIDSEYGKERDDQTLRQALSQRRFLDEANIKLQRGEGHARAFEAAIFVDQKTTGYDDQNLLGKMLMHEVPPNVIASVTNRIHESQGRLLYGFGGFRDKQTGKWSLPSLEVIKNSRADAATETDLEKEKMLEERAKFNELGFKKIIETYRLSPNMFHSITTSDRLFTEEQRIQFMKEWNKYVEDNPTLKLDPMKSHKDK